MKFMSKSKNSLLFIFESFSENHKINAIIILSLSALGCNYVHSSTKMILNAIFKCSMWVRLRIVNVKV